jgi:hypothetical protein
MRPLLAARGFAVPDRPGLRLRTLADVFAYAEAEGVILRIDGTETQVRRGKVVSPRDVCPDTGLARLSYGQARAMLDAHTALAGVQGAGWDLHEWRHSGLTHLGEAGASLPMLMAKSRHKKPENVRRYFHPSAEAIAEVTSLLAPGDSRR